MEMTGGAGASACALTAGGAGLGWAVGVSVVAGAGLSLPKIRTGGGGAPPAGASDTPAAGEGASAPIFIPSVGSMVGPATVSALAFSSDFWGTAVGTAV